MGTTDAPIIVFDNVSKWYGQFHVLRDIQLSVAKSERTSSAARRARASPR